MGINVGEFKVGASFTDYFVSRGKYPLPGRFKKFDSGELGLFDSHDLFIIVRLSVTKKEDIRRTDAVLVVDGSGSMSLHNKWDWVRESLLGMNGICEMLGPDDRVGMAIFNHTLVCTTGELVDASLAKHTISSLLGSPDGLTSTNVGLAEGYRLLKDFGRADAVQRLVFLSDGVNVGDARHRSEEESVNIVQKCAASEIDLYTVGYGGGGNKDDVYDERFMERLSTACGANAQNVRVQSQSDAEAAFVNAITSSKKVYQKNPIIAVSKRNEHMFDWRGYRMTFPVMRITQTGPRNQDWAIPLGNLSEPDHEVLFHLRLKDSWVPEQHTNEYEVPVAQFDLLGQTETITLTIHPAIEMQFRPSVHWQGAPEPTVFEQAIISELPMIKNSLYDQTLHETVRKRLIYLGLEVLKLKFPKLAPEHTPEYAKEIEFFREQMRGKNMTLDDIGVEVTKTRTISDQVRDNVRSPIGTEKVKPLGRDTKAIGGKTTRKRL